MSFSESAIHRALITLARHHHVDTDLMTRVWRIAGTSGFSSDSAPSGISHDGTPFELSLSMGPQPCGLRYLAEIGEGQKGWPRLIDSRAKLPALLEVLDVPSQPLLSLVDVLIPDSSRDFPPLRFGMWVSTVLYRHHSTLKVYINTGWRQNEVWELLRILIEISKMTAAVPRLERLKFHLRRFHRLSFIGIEASSDRLSRLKLYFRGTTLTSEFLREIVDISGDSVEVILGLWRDFCGHYTLGPEDAVLSLAIPSDGSSLSVKVDVAARVFALSDLEVFKRIQEVARARSIDSTIYSISFETLSDVCSHPPEHTMVGISATDGHPRINVYLKPVFLEASERSTLPL